MSLENTKRCKRSPKNSLVVAFETLAGHPLCPQQNADDPTAVCVIKREEIIVPNVFTILWNHLLHHTKRSGSVFHGVDFFHNSHPVDVAEDMVKLMLGVLDAQDACTTLTLTTSWGRARWSTEDPLVTFSCHAWHPTDPHKILVGYDTCDNNTSTYLEVCDPSQPRALNTGPCVKRYGVVTGMSWCPRGEFIAATFSKHPTGLTVVVCAAQLQNEGFKCLTVDGTIQYCHQPWSYCGNYLLTLRSKKLVVCEFVKETQDGKTFLKRFEELHNFGSWKIRRASFHPRKPIVLAVADHIRVWTFSVDGEPVKNYTCFRKKNPWHSAKDRVACAVWSPCGQFIGAVTDSGVVAILHTDTGEVFRTFNVDEGAGRGREIAWHPTTRYFAVLTVSDDVEDSWVIQILDIFRRVTVAFLFYPGSGYEAQLAWSADGNRLAVSDGFRYYNNVDKSLIFVDVDADGRRNTKSVYAVTR